MGYYNPFPYYTADQQATIEPLLQAVNTQIKELAEENSDTFVSTKKW